MTDRQCKNGLAFTGSTMVGLVAVLCSAVAVAAPGSARAAALSSDCSVLASGGSCSFGVSSNPTQPYTVTVPAGVSSLDVVLNGGTGSPGDYGAAAGAGGVTVMTLPVTGGQQLQLYVGSNADSYTAGTGWATGGDGVPGGTFNTDSGAGGGASAVVDAASQTVYAVAGGGGGAGGSYNNVSAGGTGGAAGLPAGDGAQGGSPPGGVARGAGGPGGPGGALSGHDGGNGGTLFGLIESGGGGGSGWQGGGGGAPPGATIAAGGGGGGGSSYVDPQLPNADNAIYASAQSPTGGSITLTPGGAVTTYPCGANQVVHLASPTNTVFAIAVGASGSQGSNQRSTAGRGAVTTARLHPDGDQNLTVIAGCRWGRGDGLGGQRGLAGEAAGADGGNGGGASYIGDADSGNAWLIAGGGGGGGGQAIGGAYGGNGGNAGLDWLSVGAASGTDGSGDDSPSGGGGGANTSNGQPVSYGDSPAKVEFLGGGSGAGGGGLQGGQGGNTFDGAAGGGGGGAGSSTFDPNHAFGATVGTAAQPWADGFVALVQEGGASGATSEEAIRSRRSAGTSPAVGSATGSGVGSLKVTARVSGSDAASHATTRFVVRVVCRLAGRDLRLPHGQRSTFGLTAGHSRIVRRLPFGVRCRVDQTDPRGATRATIRPKAPVTIGARGAAVIVANRFDAGSLTVRLISPGHQLNRQQRTRRFHVYVVCRPAHAPPSIHVSLPHNGYGTVTRGASLVLHRVPAGADCSVAPLDRALATASVDRHTVVRARERARLRIVDYSRSAPRYRIVLGAPSRRQVTITARPDDRVLVTPAMQGSGIAANVKPKPLAGHIEIVNARKRTITIRVSHRGRVLIRTRLRAHRGVSFDPRQANQRPK